MLIDPKNLSHSECYKLMCGVVVPRPIAWVSTLGENGVFNVAPFSFFAALASNPPTIAVSVGWRDGKKKDTIRNIEFTDDFVVNVVSEAVAEAMNLSSAELPPDQSEFTYANLTPVPSEVVRAPRVAEAPVSMECRLKQIIEIGDPPDLTSVMMGEVVRFHVRDDVYQNGRIDFQALQAVGRLAGSLYCRTTDIFDLKRPTVTSTAK